MSTSRKEMKYDKCMINVCIYFTNVLHVLLFNMMNHYLLGKLNSAH